MSLKKIGKMAYEGIITSNPTFRMVLGLCPTLAVTVTAANGLGMGLATLMVLLLSNMTVALLKRFIPDTVRIPCYIMIIATIATLADMLIKKFLPDLHAALGIFIPLIVVNCIVFARAESFASKNTVLLSGMDGLFTGIGFTLSLTLLASLRELFGSGSVFGLQILPGWFPLFTIFLIPAGGYLMLGFLLALFNLIVSRSEKRKKPSAPIRGIAVPAKDAARGSAA